MTHEEEMLIRGGRMREDSELDNEEIIQLEAEEQVLEALLLCFARVIGCCCCKYVFSNKIYLYLPSIGHAAASCCFSWSTGGIDRVHRFLSRTWRLIVGSPLSDGTYNAGTVATDVEPSLEKLRALHRCIDKVSEDIQETWFNTGISAMMEFFNAAYKWKNHPRSIMEEFVMLLSPYAPHMAEELWSRLGHSSSLAYERYTEAESEYLKDTSVMLPVQINGKTIGTILVSEVCPEEDAFRLASKDEKLSKYLQGNTIKKRIYVPGRIMNVIVGQQKVQA